MPGKITELPAVGTVETADLMEILDVSDTSTAATGTNKKMSMADLGVALNTNNAQLMCVPYASDGTTAFTMTSATQAERIAGNAGPRMVRHVFLKGQTQVRACGYVVTVSASVNTPRCRIRYKTGVYNIDIANNYLALGASGEIEFSVFTGQTDVDTGWVTMAPAAIAAGDIQVGISEIGGNGSASPALSYLVLWFR